MNAKKPFIAGRAARKRTRNKKPRPFEKTGLDFRIGFLGKLETRKPAWT
jgi:hypothetical protein